MGVFLVGFLGAFVGAGAVAATVFGIYKLEMANRAKAVKELNKEFNELLSEIKGLSRQPAKNAKVN